MKPPQSAPTQPRARRMRPMHHAVPAVSKPDYLFSRACWQLAHYVVVAVGSDAVYKVGNFLFQRHQDTSRHKAAKKSAYRQGVMVSGVGASCSFLMSRDFKTSLCAVSSGTACSKTGEVAESTVMLSSASSGLGLSCFFRFLPTQSPPSHS